MNAKTAQDDHRKIGSVYLFWDGEFVLDAPPKVAWPHVLNYPSWQNFPLVEHVSGPPGAEGEVVRLRKEEAGFSSPAYYARTIKLEPGHRVIWKVYLDKGTIPFELFGIVEFTISQGQDDSTTRFGYRFLYEFMVPYEEEAELEAFRKQQHDSFEGVFASMWLKLKKLVAQHSCAAIRS